MKINQFLLAMVVVAAAVAVTVYGADVTLIEDGQSRCVIRVSPRVMAADREVPSEAAQEQDRRRLRESVRDLAHYLEKMSGAAVSISTGGSAAGGNRAILIGEVAQDAFGPVGITVFGGQGCRVVGQQARIGVYGESDLGSSYAIYDVLHELGCRWYMPGDLGEVIPARKTIVLAERDTSLSPGTVSRGIWYADDAFRRRNRLGGFAYSAGHALEGYVSKEQLEQHPDWNAEIGGKRMLHRCDVGHRLCWANAEVSAAVGDRVIAMLDKNPATPCVSISPGDGSDFCECTRCKALDAGDWDASMNCVSITDRYVHFCNRVAERVTQKHPNVKLGFLAYVQFTRPPKREKLHPVLIPQLAPITYCRAHTVSDATCPSRPEMHEILTGWGKAAKNIAMYEYGYHLAEVSAPFPMIARNVEELPLQYANGVTMWTPETLPSFDTGLPGLYLGIRMAWNPKVEPRAILDEFFSNFYGAAGRPMKDHWQSIDACWARVPEHAGSGFGHMRRFTPERLAEARRLMDAAVTACETALESRRVKMADVSLRQLERFMKMRLDYFSGRFAELETDSRLWTGVHQALADEYAANYAFTKTGWCPQTVAVLYANIFFFNSYADASRIAREYSLLTPALNVWSYTVDREKNGETQAWQRTDFDDKTWKKTDVAIDTWAALGLLDYYGSVWYRSRVDIPQIPAGKKVYLWVGATDGKCKVFVNGRHVPYRNDKGKRRPKPKATASPSRSTSPPPSRVGRATRSASSAHGPF